MQRTRVLALFIAALALVAIAAWVLLGSGRAVQPGERAARDRPREAGDADALAKLEGGTGGSARDARARGATEARSADARALAFPGEHALLRGRVLDPGLAPVAGAEVELRFRPASGLQLVHDMRWQDERALLARARTDAAGEFAFQAPRARALEVVATAEGFAPARDVNVYAEAVVELVLARGCELVGRVTRASDGAPIAGAEVIVFHDAIDGEAFEGRTDAGGNYAARGLPAGNASLVVVPEVELPRNVLDVALVAGTRVVRDVVVDEGLGATGVVRDAVTKRPIEGAEVSSWAFLHKTARTDASGRYRLTGLRERPVPSLAARAKGYGPSEIAAPQLSARQYVADFELAPGRGAHGRVVDAEGRAIAGAYVAAFGSALGADQRDEQDDVHPTRTDAAGRFSITDLHAHARHFLFVRASGHADAFVPFPNSESSEPALDLGTIVLARPSSLEGVVVASSDGAPLAGVIVELHLDVDVETATSPWTGRSPFAASFRGIQTDARGRFAIADLAAGRHDLRFYRPGLVVLEGVRVELAAGETKRDLVFTMKTDGAIVGRVLDPWGNGIEGATVSVDSGASHARAQSERDGAFALGGLPDGTYTLEAVLGREYELAGRKHALARAALTGVRTGTRDVVLQLMTVDEIAGIVLDENGAPLAFAGVEARRIDGTIAETAYAGADGRFVLRVAEQSLADLFAYPSEAAEGDKFERRSMIVSETRRATRGGVRAGTRDVELRLGGIR